MADNFDYALAAKLVERAKNGDSDAFAELYIMTYQTQYNKARRYLRDEYLAQDALQEVYILALRNLDKLERPKAFAAWLGQINFRVCYNTALKWHKEHSIDELEETSPLIAEDANPEDEVIRTSESRHLFEAIASLPELDRRVVELRYGKNLKLTEVAEQLGISLSSVKRHIQSACDKLEQLMERR